MRGRQKKNTTLKMGGTQFYLEGVEMTRKLLHLK